ncbi:MAG: ParM/StbA family protein [Ruminiclostridium sp.]|nr:ParM/StbA family protein [Ruminiclostridium sp.]
MKDFKNKVIIGIDHGYGNIKTANHIFKTGVMEYDAEPLFTKDMLVYNGKYYTIGEGHKEFKAEKQSDDDYYVLTLAAIAMELDDNDLTEADVFIAAGLPLTWTSGQKAEFAEYLTKNERVTFVFRKVRYRIRIVGAKIYPQGYAAVAEFAAKMKGVNMVADIGNGTMNTLTIINGAPQQGRMFTEKFGTHQCTLAVREQFMRQTRREIDDAIIEEVLINGNANLSDDDLKIIKATATEYVNNIFRRLREHGYDAKSTTLYVTGGGGCLAKNFYAYDKSRVFFVDDICAAAKGYEHMAELQLGTGVGI